MFETEKPHLSLSSNPIKHLPGETTRSLIHLKQKPLLIAKPCNNLCFETTRIYHVMLQASLCFTSDTTRSLALMQLPPPPARHKLDPSLVIDANPWFETTPSLTLMQASLLHFRKLVSRFTQKEARKGRVGGEKGRGRGRDGGYSFVLACLTKSFDQ